MAAHFLVATENKTDDIFHDMSQSCRHTIDLQNLYNDNNITM